MSQLIYFIVGIFYWDNFMWLDGPWRKDRWETGLFMSCPVSSGAPWVVIMIVFWPTRGGVGLDTSLRRGKGHPWWSLFSKLVHRHDKNKIWITDAVIKPPPFQSQCQSWNKSVGLLLCPNFPELNPNNSPFWNIWLQSAQTKIRLYCTLKPFNLFVCHYLSQLIKNISKSLLKRQIPM